VPTELDITLTAAAAAVAAAAVVVWCCLLPPQIQSGRRVVPTELGITLIKGYQLIDPELCRPHVS
jgi:hypothetical protein